jgi:hypothetical protein
MQLLYEKKGYQNAYQEMNSAESMRNIRREELKPQSSDLYRCETVQLTAISLLSTYTKAACLALQGMDSRSVKASHSSLGEQLTAKKSWKRVGNNCVTRSFVPVIDEIKAGKAKSVAIRIPRPPADTGRRAGATLALK